MSVNIREVIGTMNEEIELLEKTLCEVYIAAAEIPFDDESGKTYVLSFKKFSHDRGLYVTNDSNVTRLRSSNLRIQNLAVLKMCELISMLDARQAEIVAITIRSATTLQEARRNVLVKAAAQMINEKK